MCGKGRQFYKRTPYLLHNSVKLSSTNKREREREREKVIEQEKHKNLHMGLYTILNNYYN